MPGVHLEVLHTPERAAAEEVGSSVVREVPQCSVLRKLPLSAGISQQLLGRIVKSVSPAEERNKCRYSGRIRMFKQFFLLSAQAGLPAAFLFWFIFS